MTRISTASGLQLELHNYDATHAPFVLSSWAKSAHQASPANRIPRALWTDRQNEHMARCLERDACVMMVLPDATDECVGWCCAGHRSGAMVVHWIYVRRLFRRQGAARALLDWFSNTLLGRSFGVDPVVATQWSKHGDWIAQRVPELAYDPYLIAEAS